MDQIRSAWGLTAFRPLQRESLEAVLAGRDSLTVMPTGSGKSLCFQGPARVLPGITLVISPLIALMKCHVESFNARFGGEQSSSFAARLGSDQLDHELVDVMQRLRSSSPSSLRRSVAPSLLYVSPERALRPELLALLAGKVSRIIIDEAHCISHWGHDFRPSYAELGKLRRMFPGVSVHAFTATATPRVRRDICDALGIACPNRDRKGAACSQSTIDNRQSTILVGDFDRPDLHLSVQPRTHFDTQLIRWIRGVQGDGIVYMPTRYETEQIAELLRLNAIDAQHYHAGPGTEADRERVHNWFLEESPRADARVVVATIAFGMGIDKPDVCWVVHGAMPSSIELYHQEIGRAGRDGHGADCVVYYHPSDLDRWFGLFAADEERSIGAACASERPPIGTATVRERPPQSAIGNRQSAILQGRRAALLAMNDFCVTDECRHRVLVEYCGQPWDRISAGCESDGVCGNCDVCDRRMANGE